MNFHRPVRRRATLCLDKVPLCLKAAWNALNPPRVQKIAIILRLGKNGSEIDHLDRILTQFEEFCTVTQSVRRGIPVNVTVEDSQGVKVKGA